MLENNVVNDVMLNNKLMILLFLAVITRMKNSSFKFLNHKIKYLLNIKNEHLKLK